MVNLPVQEPSNFKEPSHFRKLFGWSKETLELLEWFPKEALREEDRQKRNLDREIVNKLINVVDSLTRDREEPIFYRSTSHGLFDLREELKAAKIHLEKPVPSSYPRPRKAKSLSWLHWTIWNLAPFFEHTPKTASKHIGHIAWPFLAKFLLLTIDRKALRDKRKRKSVEETSPSEVDPMELLKVNRLKQSYHRIAKKKIPRDTIIRSHLQAWKQKKSPLHIFLKPIHDQAYQTLRKKLAETP